MIQQPVRPAPAMVAHGLFFDQSHDNPTPIEKRSVYDMLPTAAMVSMASCAIGSTRGYDELVRHAIHVVHEKRPYAEWGTETKYHTGLVEARRILNDLHLVLAKAHYTEVFVDQMSPDVVGITRHNPVTHDTVVVISYTAFDKNAINKDRVFLRHIPIGGVLEEILFEMRMEEIAPESKPESDEYLLGLTNYKVYIRQRFSPEHAKMCVLHGGEDGHLELTDFPSGSVLGFRVHLSHKARAAIATIRAVIAGNDELERELAYVLDTISLQDYNKLFFCTDAEEQAAIGRGAYEVPGYGKLVYCGLQAARYNCRDAVWFWLYSIERYVRTAPEGHEILNAPVVRLYPKDDTVYGEDAREETLIQTMCEALSRHFGGIEFRERNAGPAIDEHMKDEGFNVKIYVDRDTGFIHGGNRWNCGTWMDKMGSSDKAGNRGEPATPRDGAAVELQALAYCVLCALSEWNEKGFISQGGVSRDSEYWSWSQWAEKIRSSFEPHFFVGENAEGEYVNRRNIVKDTVGSSLGYTDYQLRCNFVVALATAPALLEPHKAWAALNVAKEALLGPLGIRTLDPKDWAYNGDYYNDDDGTNKRTAKGWNYHQGPEWLWVAGYYLRARLVYGNMLGGEEWKSAKKEVQARLGNYYGHIRKSAWSSLPELTNTNGNTCPGSCPAQAWSVACILEACLDFVDMASAPH
ncbi:putative glycogen debranching enzyme [Oesophagostomum dentatum]|uniref:Putative glycogen debranching enzyme n=1 Tax=Oesophagostomum dentatum TaxID=61180 RepID=A0A0B1TUK7_OESDE|nr:putative glycogen debranching enzyme [Oesophagostomum dentatum]